MLTAWLTMWIAVAAPPAATPDSVAVNPFLWYDPAARTAHVRVTAGLDGNNGGMNFNGASKGGATITVPAGWRVVIAFVNRDAIPHSAIIIPEQQPLPAIPETPAFGGAYTTGLTGGLFTDQSDELTFTASPAGRYILVCGVPGHGASGMWIRFVVSPDAQAPAYTQ
jgi:sulfocyanin